MKEKLMLKNEDGSVIIISMVVLVLITMLGIWSSNTSTIEVQIAANEKDQKLVFYAAEAGIEAGRAVLSELKSDDKDNWNRLLQGIALVGHTGISTLDGVIEEGAGNDRNVGIATFTLSVRDNDDLDGNDLVDTDNIIIITSTGTLRNAKAEIEAYVSFIGAGDEYDQEHYNADSTGVAR
jgi:Tfp pilus assembly protein PilX